MPRPIKEGGAAGLLVALLLGTAPAAADTTVHLGEALTLKPYVLLQADEAGFAQDRPGGQAAGFNPRRMRLGGRVEVADQVRLGFIWDFGHLPGADGTLFEAQASFIGLKPFTATAGVFKTNFSLESMQSAGATLMLERASIVTIARNLAAGIRREGVQLQADGERFNASLALTAGQAGPGRDGNQRAVVARAAGLPVQTGALTIHAGLSGEWVFRPASDAGRSAAISLSDGPELRIDDVPSGLSTGRIEARSGGALGPELGLGWRRLWLQGEYIGLLVNRAAGSGAGTLRFDGWYAQAAYTLVGHPRRWDGSIGAWGAPRPAERFNPAAGAWGAVELGVRFSTADLNSLDVRGGRQRVLSAGVNWWPIEPVRLSLNVEHADISGGRSPRRQDAVAGRAQLQF